MDGIKRLNMKLALATALSLGAVSQGAWGYTECSVSPARVHSGDSGNFYIFFTNGGSTIARKADPDYNATITVVMFAIATDRTLYVRYEANNVPCDSSFQELDGVSMYK